MQKTSKPRTAEKVKSVGFSFRSAFSSWTDSGCADEAQRTGTRCHVLETWDEGPRGPEAPGASEGARARDEGRPTWERPGPRGRLEQEDRERKGVGRAGKEKYGRLTPVFSYPDCIFQECRGSRGKESGPRTQPAARNRRAKPARPFEVRAQSPCASTVSSEDYGSRAKVSSRPLPIRTSHWMRLPFQDEDDDSSSLTSLDWKCKQIPIKNAVMMLNEMFPPPMVRRVQEFQHVANFELSLSHVIYLGSAIQSHVPNGSSQQSNVHNGLLHKKSGTPLSSRSKPKGNWMCSFFSSHLSEKASPKKRQSLPAPKKP